MEKVTGQLVDISSRSIYPAEIRINDGMILSIERVGSAPEVYIMPGFVDAHIHIESSMVVPYEFARIALCHGTVATVSDPHEIANVLGSEGVDYMIENAAGAELKFHFGAPSCVPATSFETAGAELNARDVEILLKRDDIYFLSEMMNYPGVLNNDSEVIAKIQTALQLSKSVDGHAPGLMGDDAAKYIAAGITTDHECFTIEEALNKLKYGMKIIIREGSAAKNYQALHSLIESHTSMTMFCSDDKHPDDLIDGHIDQLVSRSVELGYDLFDVLQVACINPVLHYGLGVGILKPGDPADFILVRDLEQFEVEKTFINGRCVAENGKSILTQKEHRVINRFVAGKVDEEALVISDNGENVPVIHALNGELITKELRFDMKSVDGVIETDVGRDILKIVVYNRYSTQPPAVGFIHGFGINDGAIASSVAHDSHNIIAVGTTDRYIRQVINELVTLKGGLAVVHSHEIASLGLPIAGLMSNKGCNEIAMSYKKLDVMAKQMGSQLDAPFMTLSFMALLVIPEIKLSDKGLFNAKTFEFY